jgi:hypothetical protein
LNLVRRYRQARVDTEVTCNRCGQQARILWFVSSPDTLAKVGKALGINGPIRPYMIIECPNCGQRAVDVLPSFPNSDES